MTRITLRRARKNQLSIVVSLNAALFPDVPLSGDALTNSVWWLAWDGNTPVGYGGLYVGIVGEAWLVRVGVVKSYRGGGIGRRLVDVRVRHWRRLASASDSLRTYTADYNISSIRNVLRAGLLPDRAYNGWIYFRLRASTSRKNKS